MSGIRLIVIMWLVAVGIVTYGHYRNDGVGMPAPSGYFGSAVTYTLLAGMAQIPGAAPLAGVFAVAWTFSLYLRVNGDGISAAPTKKKAATA